MSKRAFRVVCSLLSLMITCSLCGCADTEQLTELLKTVVFESKIEQYEAVAEEKTAEMIREPSTEAEAPEETQEAVQESEYPEDINVIPSVLYEGSCFAYQSLSESEQLWYENIAECLGTMRDQVRLDSDGITAGLDETNIDKIFQCVLMDHPELFYVEGYTYTKYTKGDRLMAIRFSGAYSKAEQVLSRKAEIDSAVQVLLDGAANLTDDYDKVKYVYDTLIRNTEYDLTAPDNQNIYSVFVNGKSVCQGYAKAVQYLLERMGVECTLVQGSVDTGEGHAWNLVKVHGSFYYVDATWGDASYLPDEDGNENGYVPEINYDYLCVTTEQLLRTHILESFVPMPACVDEKDNYYVREGALFTSYDREQMKVLFQKFIAENRPDVTVKCSDEECFRQVMTALVEEQEIFDYLEAGNNSIAYTHNEKQLSMTFWVTNE